MPQPRTITAIVGITGLTLLVPTLVATTTTDDSSAAESSGTSTQQELPARLTEVAGFGRTAEDVRRDDLVASYEAFRRERLVENCMSQAGFDYAPRLLYPHDALRDLPLASTGEVTTSGPSPKEANESYRETLSAEQLDSYYQQLMGESAADVAHLQETGEVPADATDGEFGQGGCRGEASAEVGRMWDLSDRLLPEFLTIMRTEFDSSAIADEFRSCAAEHGVENVSNVGELEQRGMEKPAVQDDVSAALEACGDIEREAKQRFRGDREGEFIAEHEAEIREHQQHYTQLAEEARNDEEFARAVKARRERAAE